MAPTEKPVMGRPRSAPAWEPKMHYRLMVVLQRDRDVHTALYEAGEGAPELIIAAVRHYLHHIQSPTLDEKYQNEVISRALSINIPDGS